MSLSSEDLQVLNSLHQTYHNQPIDSSKIEELYFESGFNKWKTEIAIRSYLNTKAVPPPQKKMFPTVPTQQQQPVKVVKVPHHEYNWFEEDYLCKTYGNPGRYGIRWNWIKHIYKINGYNVNKAEGVLKNDLKVIETIKSLHDQRNKKKEEKENKGQTFDSKQKEILDHEIKDLEGQINNLVRGRNLDLAKLSDVPSDHLLFDLHWFMKEHALKYVREVLLVLRKQNNRGQNDANIDHFPTVLRYNTVECLRRQAVQCLNSSSVGTLTNHGFSVHQVATEPYVFMSKEATWSEAERLANSLEKKPFDVRKAIYNRRQFVNKKIAEALVKFEVVDPRSPVINQIAEIAQTIAINVVHFLETHRKMICDQIMAKPPHQQTA